MVTLVPSSDESIDKKLIEDIKQQKILAPGDGIVTGRHHASADRYEADDPQNQIAGQILPYSLSGWLRREYERVIQVANGTACHPGDPNENYRRTEVYGCELETGYHEKGTCVDADVLNPLYTQAEIR